MSSGKHVLIVFDDRPRRTVRSRCRRLVSWAIRRTASHHAV